MDADEQVRKCGICGGQVHEILIKGGPKTINELRATPWFVRQCQNPRCPSNTGDSTLADAV